MSQVNVHAGRGAGKFRDPWTIKKFIDSQGSNMRKLADELGVNYTQVTETVKGIRNDRKVLRKLYDMGCPAHALSLPDGLKILMKQEKKAESQVKSNVA